VTEGVEPGVERVIRHGAGHDIDERQPTYRYDMDGSAIAPDGAVWLATTYSRSDNGANPPAHQPGRAIAPDGTSWVVGGCDGDSGGL
jgi:hypothetical protein